MKTRHEFLIETNLDPPRLRPNELQRNVLSQSLAHEGFRPRGVYAGASESDSARRIQRQIHRKRISWMKSRMNRATGFSLPAAKAKRWKPSVRSSGAAIFRCPRPTRRNWFRTLREKYFIPEDLSDDMKAQDSRSLAGIAHEELQLHALARSHWTWALKPCPKSRFARWSWTASR